MSSREDIPLIGLLRGKYPALPLEKIKAKVIAGAFKVNGETVRDPRKKIPKDAEVEEISKLFVSRGGIKLERALAFWNIRVRDKVFIDAGSSTGGFTDCLLQRGAAFVHAVDVGYNQLDFSLRRDKRVLVRERTNIMDCSEFQPPADAAVADLSFRSVIPVAEHILKVTLEDWALVLIKPQFEYTKDDVNFDGVVEDRGILRDILVKVITRLGKRGINVVDLLKSPIPGRKGNMEFFAYISRNSGGGKPLEVLVDREIPN